MTLIAAARGLIDYKQKTTKQSLVKEDIVLKILERESCLPLWQAEHNWHCANAAAVSMQGSVEAFNFYQQKAKQAYSNMQSIIFPWLPKVKSDGDILMEYWKEFERTGKDPELSKFYDGLYLEMKRRFKSKPISKKTKKPVTNPEVPGITKQQKRSLRRA